MVLKKVTVLIFTISLSPFLQAQPQFTKAQQKVQQTVIHFFEALSNRDSVNVRKYCTPDIALFENGSIWNIDTLILKAITLNTATDFKRINDIDFINTTVSRSTAWATYDLHSEITRNGKQVNVQWMETVVAIKKNKTWNIKILHSTLLKRD